ncbi:hypothetical protein [Amycolatopsis minnesotensis]|uniref:Uncharacterized protein n=1 Tax=Amycolatopsis minnesotensis TaxID=337894 RepID=A0ABN2S907_9PSEU
MDQHQPGLLVAEEHELHERHVLIRRRDEMGLDRLRIGAAPLSGNELLVLVTPKARHTPSLAAALPGLVREYTTGIELLWLGVSGLAADTELAKRLAREFGIEIAAPDGGLVAIPGAALYAGHGAGGAGWHRFRPDQPVSFHGARFPLPEWESWLPGCPVTAGEAVALPVPCGLAVRPAAGGGTADSAFPVVVNERFPKVVVEASSAAEVAELLAGLPSRPVMVVPATPEVAAHHWQIELALRLSRDIVFSTGPQIGGETVVPGGGFRPFPLVLRQAARGGDQQVLAVAPPPPGWVREGARSYRFAGGSAAPVLADVVPSGLALRAADADPDPAAGAAPFDPACWTLTLGTTGAPVGLPVLAAAERLLEALPAEERAAVKVRMAGIPDDEAEQALDPQVVSRSPAPPSPPRPPAPKPSELDSPSPPPVSPPPVSPAPVSPAPVMTVSGAPVSTVGGAVPSRPIGQLTSPPPRPEPRDVPAAQPPAAQPEVVEPPPGEAPEPPAQEAEPSPAPPEGQELVRPVEVSVRASTTAEQNRFVTAAGEDFGIALATVNAALATWPAMRADDSPAGKADYVAVCLYLSRGEGAAGSVNGVLRTGEGAVPDGQIPCLMSGLRRLPIHRRAVLRQGRVSESLEHRGGPGTVLTEPGFLAASMNLDVTVPGADLDVLIWPASARRTSELMLSRPVGEAVFTAGARFKTLAVRSVPDDQDEREEDPDALAAPKIAVLFRELAPGEALESTELDDRDRAVLAKLDTVLEGRRNAALRLVDDPDTIARLTTSMLLWRDEAAGEDKSVAVAS